MAVFHVQSLINCTEVPNLGEDFVYREVVVS